MTTISALAQTATLIGEPARTAMLVALMDGRSLTAGELARAAGVAASTASGHLAALTEARLLDVHAQGRHRYFGLASPAIAEILESMMSVAGQVGCRRIVTGPRDQALRRARVCYDHLAGEVAVALADALVARGYADIAGDGAAITQDGLAFLIEFGFENASPDRQTTQIFCRPCMDWSERRPHVAGRVGHFLLQSMTDRHWLRRVDGSRALALTPAGVLGLEQHFGIR